MNLNLAHRDVLINILYFYYKSMQFFSNFTKSKIDSSTNQSAYRLQHDPSLMSDAHTLN